jgi:molybdenum cofactor cytidylyltransferase
LDVLLTGPTGLRVGELMRAQTISIDEAAGRLLCCPIFRQGGKRLLAKGHLIRPEDVELLATEGLNQVWVTVLDEGEISEDDAVLPVGVAMACGSLEVRPAPGGRANLFTTEDCCVLVDDSLLKEVNCAGPVVVATAPNFAHVPGGGRVATVKSAPFAVQQDQLSELLGLLEAQGPLLQARPIADPAVAILYTDPLQSERGRQLFEAVMRQRLARFNLSPRFVLTAIEDEEQVAKGLSHLLRTSPTLILIASTTAPAGPEDTVGRAMARVGCQIERFLAPVEPGNLLLLGYAGDVPVISAPGCYRSARTNIVDLLLPPLLARYRVSGWEIACMGHGGLLS